MPIPGWDQPVASRPVSLVGDSDDEIPLLDFLVPEEQLSLASNVKSVLMHFPIQISLVPAIGTNRLLSGAMENHFSLNVLGGYANGVRGAEIGGLFNIDRENVIGFQAAGLTNLIGANVKGLQAGGLFNHVGGSVAGFQIGGFFNKARRVDGVQIGLVNMADTIGGAQIGLININKTGYTSFELSANETMQPNLAYKSGNRRLYSIFTMGARFNNGSQAWSYGAGLGSLQDLGSLTLSLDVLCQQINEEQVGPDRLNLVIPARLSLGLKLGSMLELYGGASANLHLSNGFNYSSDQFTSSLGQNSFWRDDNGRTLKQGWVGYQAGVRVNLHGGVSKMP